MKALLITIIVLAEAAVLAMCLVLDFGGDKFPLLTFVLCWIGAGLIWLINGLDDIGKDAESH